MTGTYLNSDVWWPNRKITPPSVIRAQNLPRLKNAVGKKRQFFVTVTSEITTKKTAAVRSVGQTVRWDETLGALWVTHPPFCAVTLTGDRHSVAPPSSHLRICVYAKRSICEDILAGTLEIPFDSFHSSYQSGLSFLHTFLFD